MADLSAVRDDIAKGLHDRSHDDGSLAPLLIRFAWHSSGTYDAQAKTGGSNGGTIWLAAENDPENKGFDKAKAMLRRVHKKHAGKISLADLAVLGGCVAIEETGGPVIPFAVGRADWTPAEAKAKNKTPTGCPFGDGKVNPHGSRLPPADLGPDLKCPVTGAVADREKPTIDAVRKTFRRMGFDDRETVLLIVMGHQYGRCHPEVSGYEHPWYSFAPGYWNSGSAGHGFLALLGAYINRFREVTNSSGNRQWEVRMGAREPFMMLPSDMCLVWDPDFRRHLTYYEKHRREFNRDSAATFKKLIELGCENLRPEK
jgi:catalase (peroxidase I)